MYYNVNAWLPSKCIASDFQGHDFMELQKEYFCGGSELLITLCHFSAKSDILEVVT